MTTLFNVVQPGADYQPHVKNTHPLADFLRQYISIQFPGNKIYAWDLPTGMNQIHSDQFHSASCYTYPHMIETIQGLFKKNGELLEFGVLGNDGSRKVLVIASVEPSVSPEDQKQLWEAALAGSEVINLYYRHNRLPKIVDFYRQLKQCMSTTKSSDLTSQGSDSYAIKITYENDLLKVELNNRAIAKFDLTGGDSRIADYINDWKRLGQCAGIPVEIDIPDPSSDEHESESMSLMAGA